MNVSAFTASTTALARLQGLAPPSAPVPGVQAEARAAGPAQWLLADDGVGGALLAAGPRSSRLPFDDLERQFLAALTRPAADAG